MAEQLDAFEKSLAHKETIKCFTVCLYILALISANHIVQCSSIATWTWLIEVNSKLLKQMCIVLHSYRVLAHYNYNWNFHYTDDAM